MPNIERSQRQLQRARMGPAAVQVKRANAPIHLPHLEDWFSFECWRSVRHLADVGKPILHADGSPLLRENGRPHLYGPPVLDRMGLPILSPNGAQFLAWTALEPNLITTLGLNHVLIRVMKGQATPGAGYPEGRRIPRAWATGTAYAVGDVVRPITPGSNNRMYICEVAGTSHASTEPTWPTTDGASVADNTVTWREASHWFVGLVTAKSTGYAVGDTMASHGGWTESAPYSNATRPTCVYGTVAGGSVDNSASKATFNINATATIYGALLVDLATIAVLTVGSLFGVADFTGGSRAVQNADTLQVTVTSTAS